MLAAAASPAANPWHRAGPDRAVGRRGRERGSTGLTWRRDCIDLIWALKSFYHFSGVDYPLTIHDGGLEPWQFSLLQSHFPQAAFVTMDEADQRVESLLSGAS